MCRTHLLDLIYHTWDFCTFLEKIHGHAELKPLGPHGPLAHVGPRAWARRLSPLWPCIFTRKVQKSHVWYITSRRWVCTFLRSIFEKMHLEKMTRVICFWYQNLISGRSPQVVKTKKMCSAAVISFQVVAHRDGGSKVHSRRIRYSIFWYKNLISLCAELRCAGAEPEPEPSQSSDVPTGKVT